MTHAVSRAAPRRSARPAVDGRHVAATPLPELLRTAWVSWFPYVVIGLGALARLRQWLGSRSLWLDEVLIADNLVHRGFALLLTEDLTHSQTAPLLWLWAERLLVDVFGGSERALRLLPLLAGLAVLWLTLVLARQVLPRVLVPVPVLLVCLHPGLVYYSNEVKQYSTDVLVVLVLVLLAFRVPSRTADGPALRRFSAAATVAVWASHPSVFVLAALSLVLVLRPTFAGDTRRALRVALVLSPWLVSLLVSYVTVLQRTTENEPLFAYWSYSFPRGFLDLPAWFLRRWYDLAHLPLQLTFRPIGLALLGFGLYRLCKHGGRSASLLWAAVPVALLGAAISAYPFAGRLALWLVPIAAITMTAAIPHRYVHRRTAWLLAATTALTLVSAPAVARAVGLTVRVQEVEELRPLLERFSEVRQPGDLVLVEVATREAFEYYAEQTGVSRDGVILFGVRKGLGPCDDLPALNAGRFATDRVWVLSSHRLVDTARLGTVEDMLARIRTVTREVDHLHDTRADAWLFDPSTGPQTLTQVGPRNPERCLSVVRSAR
ncbi:MAG: hypothetical protein JWN77_634 [Frankiales bacterium]|nr:hypothetical protein [Frankiales bacterium]